MFPVAVVRDRVRVLVDRVEDGRERPEAPAGARPLAAEIGSDESPMCWLVS